MIHNSHKVLGNYCWDCRAITKADVPGWNKKAKSSLQSFQAEVFEVVWADGGRNSASNCNVCSTPRCKYPVHGERYGEKSSGLMKAWDASNPTI